MFTDIKLHQEVNELSSCEFLCNWPRCTKCIHI